MSGNKGQMSLLQVLTGAGNSPHQLPPALRSTSPFLCVRGTDEGMKDSILKQSPTLTCTSFCPSRSWDLEQQD